MTGTQCLECGAPIDAAAAAQPLCPACALRGALDAAAPGAQAEDASGPVLADARLPALGDRFGDYRLIREIARGGMGVVYLARQVSLDRDVAVKMLLPGLATADYLRRFRAEASTAAALQHPSIVAIHEVGVWQGQPCLVLDYVDGPNLAERVEQAGDGGIDFRQSAEWVKAIAEAVDHAHERGILHRDLKPSNVLIDPAGHPRVTDFGLAKRFDQVSQLTLSGAVVGSPAFMPPEQASAGHGKVSRRSDVYGLGAILYHLLAGRPPFQGETPTDVLHQVLHDPPAALRAVETKVPRDLETICLKCLEKDPARRYPTAKAVAEELDRFLAGQPIAARPVGAAGKAWRWLRKKPLVAALGATLVFSGWLGWNAVSNSRALEQSRMQKAIDDALAAAWAGDERAAERAAGDAQRLGAPQEWVEMIHGQVALYDLRVEDAIAHFDRAVALNTGSVASRAMLATACLWAGQMDRYVGTLETVQSMRPREPEDFLFLGAALVSATPDTKLPVTLLEYARQKHPSALAFLQLALAEGFHAQDSGSWPMAQRAWDHSQLALETLGPAHPLALAVRLNAANFGLRLCPAGERAAQRQRADAGASALQSTSSPLGHMQRAFYAQIVGDETAELEAWRQMFQRGRGGLFASYYASGTLGRGRSADGLESFDRLSRQDDTLAAVARAYLLLDLNRRGDALDVAGRLLRGTPFSKALAAQVMFVAGETAAAARAAAALLKTTSPEAPGYPVLRFVAGVGTEQEFESSAGSSGAARCTVNFYLAVSRLTRGDREAARQRFRQALSTGAHWLPDYQWSRAFLMRLDQDPRWPAWMP